MKELIKKLTEAFGPSGQEEGVRNSILAEIKRDVDETRVDALGNLIAVKRATPSRKGSSSPLKVMLAAHMDEIGVIVTHVDDKGFLRFAPVGGVTSLILLGGRVVFADGTLGTFGLEKRESPNKMPKLTEMYLDVGARDKESVPVSVGDIAAFERDFADL
ncbi:MAG: M42 family peptidase, partial [Anaerolineae bacterium]